VPEGFQRESKRRDGDMGNSYWIGQKLNMENNAKKALWLTLRARASLKQAPFSRRKQAEKALNLIVEQGHVRRSPISRSGTSGGGGGGLGGCVWGGWGGGCGGGGSIEV